MQLHKNRDPLPISLLHLFITDNFEETLDSKEFELIWADTEFCYVNEEWVWQKSCSLVYEDQPISTSLPFEEYKKFYLDDDISYTKHTYDIPDNAE